MKSNLDNYNNLRKQVEECWPEANISNPKDHKEFIDFYHSYHIIDPDKLLDAGESVSEAPENFTIQVAKKKPFPLNDLIYHYCSTSTFVEIIKNKKLFLSNSKIMNDYTEGVWINRWILNEFQNADSEYKKYLTHLLKTYEKRNTISYISCFSENPDILSQWRGYAEDGTGVSIGFSCKKLPFKYHLPRSCANSIYNTGIHYVEYNQKDQEDIVRKIIYDSIYQNMPSLKNDAYLYNDFLPGVDILSSLATIYKNKSFKEEKEWRVIYRPHRFDHKLGKEAPWILDDNNYKLSFKERAGEIISYFEVSIEDIFDSELIPQIYLGPKCKISQEELRFILTAHGLYDVDIKVSEATYR